MGSARASMAEHAGDEGRKAQSDGGEILASAATLQQGSASGKLGIQLRRDARRTLTRIGESG